MKTLLRCALCQEEDELMASHIIPKFVFRYLKKDSFTGKMRRISQPNISLQDGDKRKMLCNACEGRFSKNETSFSNNFFFPFKNDGFSSLKYEGDWLNHFITSVNWRTLYLDLQGFEENGYEKITGKQLILLKKAEEVMRLYLMNKRRDLGAIENHIFFFDTLKSADEITASMGPYSFIQGSAFGYTVLTKSDGIYVYANLAGIIIVTIIKKHKKEKWKNTYIKNESGRVRAPQCSNSDLFSELNYLLRKRIDYKSNMSEKQRKRIEEKIESNPEKFKESGTFRRLMKDSDVNL